MSAQIIAFPRPYRKSREQQRQEQIEALVACTSSLVDKNSRAEEACAGRCTSTRRGTGEGWAPTPPPAQNRGRRPATTAGKLSHRRESPAQCGAFSLWRRLTGTLASGIVRLCGQYAESPTRGGALHWRPYDANWGISATLSMRRLSPCPRDDCGVANCELSV
jgi:hypothetical protein